MINTLTNKEEKLLIEIDKYSVKSEPGFSEFLDGDVKTKSRAGVLSSLIKKDFVYDSYKNADGTSFKMDEKDISMYVITDNGLDALREVGHDIVPFEN